MSHRSITALTDLLRPPPKPPSAQATSSFGSKCISTSG